MSNPFESLIGKTAVRIHPAKIASGWSSFSDRDGYYSESVDYKIFDKNEHELVYTTIAEYQSLRDKD
jgi:hypothetical protein